MEDKREKAAALFQEGYNCAQAVFAAYAEDYGFTREQALRLAASFGGGIGRMRETCGAFSGAAMVLGLETGTVTGSDAAGKQRKSCESVVHYGKQKRHVAKVPAVNRPFVLKNYPPHEYKRQIIDRHHDNVGQGIAFAQKSGFEIAFLNEQKQFEHFEKLIRHRR